jgi:hypothetical protein
VVLAALVITGLVILKRNDVAYSLVIIWALEGILTKQIENLSIATTAGASIITITILMILRRSMVKKEVMC